MTSIVVTGASGAVGRRLVDLLSAGDGIERIVAIDRRAIRTGASSAAAGSNGSGAAVGRVERRRVDVVGDDLEPVFEGADSVVHLVDGRAERRDLQVAMTALDRVLGAASEVGCGHAVVLSSALVYGARPDNPIPITEAQPIVPNPTLFYAVAKAELEARAQDWAAQTGSRLAVLRPVATLSEGDSSWIGSALRAATNIRPEQVESPVQFLHHDDLASAVALSVQRRLGGAYNIAPDGWIGNSEFRRLRGEAELRLPPRVAAWRFRAAKAVGDHRLLDGLEPYVTWPWVVSNDRLRAEGWAPGFSSQEAYVAGTPPPFVGLISPRRRQEVALGVASSLGAAALGVAAWTAKSSASRFRR